MKGRRAAARAKSKSVEEKEAQDTLIAARALGDMRAQPVPVPLQSPGAGSSTDPLTTLQGSATPEASPTPTGADENLVSRLSKIPLVNTALWAYGTGKNSSKAIKYGAEMVESSVTRFSKPVLDRLPTQTLDDFACRQLDRLGYTPPEASSSSKEKTIPSDEERKKFHAIRGEEILSPPSSRAPSIAPNDEDEDRQTVSRSKWHELVLEAGGLGAAVSVESMRRLKYCLQWLHYATSHTDAQIVLLRDFIASLPDHPPQERLQALNTIRADVVRTVRQVLDVVSTYAGSALPEPARSRVRAYVLRLPQRWASAAKAHQEEDIAASSSGGSSKRSRTGEIVPAPPSAGVAARRILALATESLDMMRSVMANFQESLDRAEAWVERFRALHIMRPSDDRTPTKKEKHEAPAGLQETPLAPPPPPPWDAPSPGLISTSASMNSLSINSFASTPQTPLETEDEEFSDESGGSANDELGGGRTGVLISAVRGTSSAKAHGGKIRKRVALAAEDSEDGADPSMQVERHN